MKHLDKFADGWIASYDIRDEWIDVVDKTLDRCLEKIPSLRIIQIKEKFGELRIYTTHDSDRDVTRWVRDAERKVARRGS